MKRRDKEVGKGLLLSSARGLRIRIGNLDSTNFFEGLRKCFCRLITFQGLRCR